MYSDMQTYYPPVDSKPCIQYIIYIYLASDNVQPCGTSMYIVLGAHGKFIDILILHMVTVKPTHHL